MMNHMPVFRLQHPQKNLRTIFLIVAFIKMRLLDTNTSPQSDSLILCYGQPFTMRSMHGRMLTYNTHDYSNKTYLNAFVQISNDATSSAAAQPASLAADSVRDYVKSLYENASPTHYGKFIMQPGSGKVPKNSPVCYGQIVHIFFVRDQDQKKESCGKYLIMNGNFPQLGFIHDGDHQNEEPIAISALKTLPEEELVNYPVRIGEDIGLKRVVCNQLDKLYLSCRKTSNLCQRNKSNNLASWEKLTLCQADGKPVSTTERERLLNQLYPETNYLRDRTVIISFRNQFKKAVPKESIPSESELKNILETQIAFPVESITYLDSMNDWSEDLVDEEEIEESTTSDLGKAQKEHETPKVLQDEQKEKKIFTKYAKVVLQKKQHRDILGHLFYYELNKQLYLKIVIPKDFSARFQK